jgi:uncharacterized protein (TIGR02145 family)
MAYVSTLTKTHEDVTVFGGLFQWGRRDAAHAQRCSAEDEPDFFTTTLYTTYNYLADFKFVTVSGIRTDWLSSVTSPDNRWGDGINYSVSFQPPINRNNGDDFNNICPAGFHVPLQREWASIGKEGDGFGESSNDFFHPVGVPTPNGYTTWVCVKDAKVSNSWSSGTNEGNTNYSDLCGYALYKKDVWDSAGADYKNGSLSLATEGAPEPLMFLPVAGTRSGINISYTGERAYYWSSTNVFAASFFQPFVMLLRYNSVEVINNPAKSRGNSVRCVAD